MAPAPIRPDPDALLQLAAREGLGRLKVFLGAAPGVGKTFEMLVQAHRRRLGGADVVAGLIVTHGRAETEAQLGELEMLPHLRLEYRGQALEEFDLDAALARRPDILLLDELAHSNAAGSRHLKRWQDVAALREAGIEVWTTVNVQHLESLAEAVARITGVRVAETVPDAVLAGADAVELVDIPPAELLERLRQGRVYRPDQARRAMLGFFREGNLAALRELALRRTAERVDADVAGYMRAHAIPGPWPSGDRVLALVGADAAAQGVVRHARRVAEMLHAPLVALHVELPGQDGAMDPVAALHLAESLGAEVERVASADLPGAILEAARARNATHLVIGRGRPPRWRRLLGRTLSAALIGRARGYTIHLVPEPMLPEPAPSATRIRTPPGWLSVPLGVGAATLVALALDGVVQEGALGMVYLAAVVAGSVAAGATAAFASAFLGFICWNVLFLPPRYQLIIAGPQDLVGVVVFGLVSVLLAGTTGGLGRSVRIARARLFSLRRLYEFSRRLAAPASVGDLLTTIAQEAERVAGCPACVLMPLAGGTLEAPPDLVLRAAVPAEAEPEEAAMAAARFAFQHGRATGRGTDTLPAAAWQFRPLRTANGILGLLGLQPGEAASLNPERDRTLAALLDQAAVAVERAQLIEERAQDMARRETEALRGALLASLGHDLRTPLTAIRGAADTLRESGPRLSEASRADLLATIGEEAVRMNRFLANILDMARIEAGEVAPARDPLDLAEAAEEAALRAERLSGRRVGRDLPSGLPRPRLDPVLLDQVLANLLDNALKFSGPQGQVRVTLVREGAEVVLAVEDDGPGIPAADLPRVFSPFYRATRTDRIAAGSGLGLAICRGLVAAMQGRILAESPIAAGHGTRVQLRFIA